MTSIVYLSETRVDKNDGKTPETAVYSKTRAFALAGGNGELRMPRASFERLAREVENENK